eukprot:jgi/Orpsp1_1/1177399/evm.model.c7180000061311.2
MSNKNIQEFLKNNIPEWSDEERMQTLFTAFREIRDKNYDTLFIESNNDKLFFWKNVIYLAQQEKLLNQNNNILTFSGKNLDKFFCRNGLTPSCIGSVINELYNKGELKELNSYRNPTGWKLNVIKFIFSPVTWSFSKIIGNDNDNYELKDITYVNITILKQLCEEILKIHYNNNYYKIDNLITKSEFTNKYKTINLKDKNLNLSELDIDLILIELNRMNNINLINQNNIIMLKFKEKNDKNKNITFTSNDINILKLKNSIEIITKQVEQDESKKNSIQDKVKECVKNKQKVKALYLLKEKKMIQQFIEKKMSSYNTLQSILLKIQSCESDNDILNAMKLGSDTLKQYIEENKLSIDRIDDVFTYIEDTFMDFEEIESTIKQNQSLINPNDTEFENEFNKLLQEETQNISKLSEDNKNTIEESTSEINKVNTPDMLLEPTSSEYKKEDNESIDKIEEKLAELAI